MRTVRPGRRGQGGGGQGGGGRGKEGGGQGGGGRGKEGEGQGERKGGQEGSRLGKADHPSKYQLDQGLGPKLTKSPRNQENHFNLRKSAKNQIYSSTFVFLGRTYVANEV